MKLTSATRGTQLFICRRTSRNRNLFSAASTCVTPLAPPWTSHSTAKGSGSIATCRNNTEWHLQHERYGQYTSCRTIKAHLGNSCCGRHLSKMVALTSSRKLEQCTVVSARTTNSARWTQWHIVADSEVTDSLPTNQVQHAPIITA